MLELFSTKIWSVWMAGGWVMIPLMVLSLMIYSLATRLLFYFSQRGFHRVSETEWMGWVKNPSDGKGEVGEIIRYTQEDVKSPGEINSRFAEVMSAKIPSIDRRLSTLNTLIAAAPLLGLLGTVFGMLMTFKALASGGAGQVTDQMAAGISQALFPPEVGLCVALPGLLLVYVIKRKRQEYEAFLARVESYTIQYYKKNFGIQDDSNQTIFVKNQACTASIHSITPPSSSSSSPPTSTAAPAEFEPVSSLNPPVPAQA